MSQAPAASPCTGVCRMDTESGWCLGCLRSIDEIVAWASYDEADKRRVWAMLPLRRQQLAGEPGQPVATKASPSR